MGVVVLNHVTLDGVMQGPGRSDEDTRNGFSHGGWAVPGNDDVMGRVLGARMGGPDGGLLLGRRSYAGMLACGTSRVVRSRRRSIVRRSGWPRQARRRGSSGPTHPCCTATFRPPWRSSSEPCPVIS
jgi:hypothetical protein